MFYVYLLKNREGLIYVGYSSDLRQRLKDHNFGRSDFTKVGRPWKLVYYEAYLSRTDAIKREGSIKEYGSIIGQLKKRITNSLGWKAEP
ncbi:MAG: putative endonuclease [Parcubacteria group bacterium LiPW_15]|nr:MAG: putative endonuclease [Parcubacteria group bacterium LiPW_15]